MLIKTLSRIKPRSSSSSSPVKRVLEIGFFFCCIPQMGCFLGCFGFSKKKGRRKGVCKNGSGVKSFGRYVPLDSNVAVKLDKDEMQEASRDNSKESSIVKIKKKVSFNLNVKTYEPIPKGDEAGSCFSEGANKTMWGYDEEETPGASMKYLDYEEENWVSSKLGSFPANYRYQNCRNSYDEEDEIELEDSGFEDEDLDFDEEFGESHDEYCHTSSQVEVRQLKSASEEADEIVNSAPLAAEKGNNLIQPQLQSNQDRDKTESNQIARKRCQYAFSVLNPVENLTQWKEVKANSRKQIKLQKENIMLDQEQDKPSEMKISGPLPLGSLLHPNRFGPIQELPVDASLSNWLVSSRS